MTQLRPIVAAQVAIVGGLLIAVPQHTASIVRLGLAAVAASAAAVTAKRTFATMPGEPARTSPLDRTAQPPVPALDPPGLATARRAITGATVVRADTPPLSTDAWQRLVMSALVTLHGRGIDIDNPRTRDAARRLLSGDAWRTITAPVPHHLSRDLPTRPGDGAEIAATVHTLLDELDRLGAT